MSDKKALSEIKEQLFHASKILQELPERHTVTSDTDILFDTLAKEYYGVLSSIIDYLEQQ